MKLDAIAQIGRAAQGNSREPLRPGVVINPGGWEFSRGENSARAERAVGTSKGLRRCTRHYGSQRKTFHPHSTALPVAPPGTPNQRTTKT